MEFTQFEEVIFTTLQTRQGETVTRDELYKALYPNGGQLPTSNGLEVFMRRIRVKLGDTATVETVRGIGYRLKPAHTVTGDAVEQAAIVSVITAQ